MDLLQHNLDRLYVDGAKPSMLTTYVLTVSRAQPQAVTIGVPDVANFWVWEAEHATPANRDEIRSELLRAAIRDLSAAIGKFGLKISRISASGRKVSLYNASTLLTSDAGSTDDGSLKKGLLARLLRRAPRPGELALAELKLVDTIEVSLTADLSRL